MTRTRELIEKRVRASTEFETKIADAELIINGGWMFEDKSLKRFKDLSFKRVDIVGSKALLSFKNGIDISVIKGTQYYSNGVNTYEFAFKKDGIFINTILTDYTVKGYNLKEVVDLYIVAGQLL